MQEHLNWKWLFIYHSCSHIRDDNLAVMTDIDLALDYDYLQPLDSWGDLSPAHGSYLGHLLIYIPNINEN